MQCNVRQANSEDLNKVFKTFDSSKYKIEWFRDSDGVIIFKRYEKELRIYFDFDDESEHFRAGVEFYPEANLRFDGHLTDVESINTIKKIVDKTKGHDVIQYI